jgi:peptidoglycan/LPS O-acetylase OafA/YrhL
MPPANPVWLDRSRPNSLNLFRLIFAGMVIVSHSWNLRAERDPFDRWFNQSWSLGSIAVDGFFIISGFLIVGSWCSPSNRADQFLRNRIVRIVPGFVGAALLSLGLAAAGPHGLAYLHSINPTGIPVDLLTLRVDFLDNALAFSNLPFPHKVNGSLWTIPLEFNCYLAVALAGSMGCFRRRRTAGLIFLAIWLVYGARDIRYGSSLGTPWRFAACFGAGGMAYLFRDAIPRSRILAGACLIALAASLRIPNALPAAIPVFGAYALLYAAFGLPAPLNAVGTRRDISYGVYLYSFPMQQCCYRLAFAGRLPTSPYVNILAAGALAIGAGWLSWKFVEAPFLRSRRGESAIRTAPGRSREASDGAPDASAPAASRFPALA